MSLRIALLGLLRASGPSSGYDLAKSFESTLNYVWQAGHSQIYPELVKMAADGLVTVEAEGARGRKVYAITPEGSAQLRGWLLEQTPSLTVRSESALQAFLLPVLDPSDAVAALERLRERYVEKVAMLETLCDAHGSKAFGRYALDHGLRHARTTIEWVDDTIATISRDIGHGGSCDENVAD
ncbi:PadR family transcriptional regulator [Nonomuraea dietziae]|uniref:PadR family transcriptional regulator n=1 Tax=Nonomuraea dietziae TaxID=65515 RepID=UPI0033CBA078